MHFVNNFILATIRPDFLELLLSANVCMHVCLRVCLPPRLLITSGVMWCGIDPVQLVKEVLWLLYDSCSRYRYWV